MTDTNQLPLSVLSDDERSTIYQNWDDSPGASYNDLMLDVEQAVNAKLQARAQVQGEPVAWKYQPQDGIKHPAFTEHEAIAIAHGKDGSVVPLYATPQPAQATQAEVTDDVELDEQFHSWIGTIKDAHDESLNDEHASSRSMLRGVIDETEDARAILALRPVQVPMTDLPEGDVTYFDGRGDAVDGYTAERVWEILRSHGITAQAQKGGAA